MDAYALWNLEIFRSTVTLRNDFINYLNTNDISPDGFLLELFAGILWSQYLNEIKRDGTYGDEITLRAIANVFGIEIIVFSTLGQQGLVHVQPVNSEPLSRVIFGNFAEGQGFHCDVLEDKFNLIEEQSDSLGEKSNLITDEINLVEHEINRSENDTNSEEDEINRSENDINLGENEINRSENDIN